MQTGLLKHGSDWNGPKYKISWKARREMELDKSSTNKNNPRMVELSKFPSSSTLPAPLPSGLKNKEIVEIVLAAQKDLATKRSYTKRLRTVFKLMHASKIGQTPPDTWPVTWNIILGHQPM